MRKESIILLLLFGCHIGQALKCYTCSGECKDMTTSDCKPNQQCIAKEKWTDGKLELQEKSCADAAECSAVSPDKSLTHTCCSTDLCNGGATVTKPPGGGAAGAGAAGAGAGAAGNGGNGQALKCYTCSGECKDMTTYECKPNQQCIAKEKWTDGKLELQEKSCADAADCSAVSPDKSLTHTCCSTNLCNGRGTGGAGAGGAGAGGAGAGGNGGNGQALKCYTCSGECKDMTTSDCQPNQQCIAKEKWTDGKLELQEKSCADAAECSAVSPDKSLTHTCCSTNLCNGRGTGGAGAGGAGAGGAGAGGNGGEGRLMCKKCSDYTCMFEKTVLCEAGERCATKYAYVAGMHMKKSDCVDFNDCSRQTTEIIAGTSTTVNNTCCHTNLCNFAITLNVPSIPIFVSVLSLMIIKLY